MAVPQLRSETPGGDLGSSGHLYRAEPISAEEGGDQKKGLLQSIFGTPVSRSSSEEVVTSSVEVSKPMTLDEAVTYEATEKRPFLGVFGPAKVDTFRTGDEYEVNHLPAVPVENHGFNLNESDSQHWVDHRIEDLKQEFLDRSCLVNDPELALGPVERIIYEAAWAEEMQRSYWARQPRASRTLEQIYSLSLLHSYEVKDLTLTPRIDRTSIGIASAEFDTELFAEGEHEHVDEPTGTTLATGTTGRLVEDRSTGEVGLRTRLLTGTEIEFANAVETLKNNSTFLDPNPQTQSEVVVRVIQPLMRGAGKDYNTISLKIAVLDEGIAYEEMITGLEDFLLQVNQSYWGLFLARAAYSLRLDLVEDTRGVVNLIEDREEIDAESTASEIVRARAALLERRADLIRTKTAIRIAEERLRSLVNDPNLPMGVSGEMIPVSHPALSPVPEDIGSVVQIALNNRSELQSSYDAIRVAGLRRDSARNDLKPRLNLTGEAGYYGLDSNRDLAGAYDNLNSNGPGLSVGLTFSQTFERRFAKSFYDRRDLEFEQAVNRARISANTVILSALVAYREMITAYRDVQAKYQALRAQREEVKQLNDLVTTDAGEESGRSIGSRLQILLDAIDRNQRAEEEYLVSIVSYNYSLAALERAKGTFLKINRSK